MKRGERLAELRVDVGHRRFQLLDHGEMQLQEPPLMGRDATRQGVDQRRAFVLQRPARQVGQSHGVRFAGDERAEDRPPAHAEEVTDQAGDLQIRDIQGLLKALGVLGDLADQLFARAGQVPHVLNRRRGHEAPAQEPVREQVGDPRRIVDITLAAGDALDVPSVRQHEREGVFEHVPHAFPVRPRRLHRHVRHTLRGQPIRQRQQVARRHAEGATLLTDLRAVETNTRDQRIFPQVESRAPRIHDLHDQPFPSASARSPPERSLRRALPVANVTAHDETTG
jgi:hypothetical protein